MVKAIPDQQSAPIPYLSVQGAAQAIDFYKQVFGATEIFRMADPSGRVGHAELALGGGRIFIADEYPDHDFRSPHTLGGSPVMIHLYVEDVDEVGRKAEAAGAKMLRAIDNQFYGDRGGTMMDPFGHRWYIATHIEDVTPEEMARRAKEMFGG